MNVIVWKFSDIKEKKKLNTIQNSQLISFLSI